MMRLRKGLGRTGLRREGSTTKFGRCNYLRDTPTGWAMRALDVAIATVTRVAQYSQAKFQRITTVQQISDRL